MTAIVILGLIAALVLGLFVGGAYFGALWWGAALFARSNHLPTTIALMCGRLALMAAVLAAVAIYGGGLPLLATTLGIAVARRVVMRRVKAMPS